MQIYKKLEAALQEREAAGLRKRERIIATSQATELMLSGSTQPVLNFCANNYLGLANHPKVIEAAHLAMNVYGYGLSSVRFICGTRNPQAVGGADCALSGYGGLHPLHQLL